MAAKLSKKIAALLDNEGIDELRYTNNGERAYQYMGKNTVNGVVYMDPRQTTANLPFTGETEDWIGYFATKEEAQLAVIQHVIAETK